MEALGLLFRVMVGRLVTRLNGLESIFEGLYQLSLHSLLVRWWCHIAGSMPVRGNVGREHHIRAVLLGRFTHGLYLVLDRGLDEVPIGGQGDCGDFIFSVALLLGHLSAFAIEEACPGKIVLKVRYTAKAHDTFSIPCRVGKGASLRTNITTSAWA